MKKFLSILFVLVLALLLVACGESKDKKDEEKPDDKKEEVTKKLTLDTASCELEEGKTKTVIATKEGVEGEVQWTTSDANVATVENGTITAIKAGTCTITAAIDGLTQTVEVEVKAVVIPVKTYTVKFYDADYKVISEQVIEEGHDAVAPEIADTDTKVFIGWNTDFTNVHSNLDILGNYSKKSIVSLNANGGYIDGTKLTTYVEGVETELPSAHCPGTKFLGWESSKNPGQYITKISKNMKGELTLTAKYSNVAKVNVNMDYAGGISNDVYLANSESALASMTLDYYGASGYWGGGYTDYLYITDKAGDPGATFSDRFYIGLDSETGLYKVVSILLSGASSWPKDAQYLIVYSSSYKNHYNVHYNAGVKVQEGDYVVFDGDFTKIRKGLSSVNAYFFREDPTVFDLDKTLDLVNDIFATPSRLGYKFLGWADEYGNDIESVADAYEGAKLIAQWEERTPVTSISTNAIPEELVTSQNFKIVASVVPSDAYFKQVYYKTSDKDIIEVDDKGNLVARSAGTCVITIYDYMKKAPIEKTITVYSVDSIDVNMGASDAVLAVGETLQLNAKAYGKDRETLTFTYESLTPTTIDVSTTGLITAKALGTGTVLVKDSANGTHTLEINVTIASFNEAERVDQVLKLIADNNIATVQAGNICLYNDGTERYYRASYSSVNYFSFEPYVVDKTYLNSTANPDGSPKVRRFNETFNDSIEFVTVHDTATLTGQASNTANSMRTSGTTGSATIHYATGQGKIYASVDEQFIAYHAGDGTGTPFYWTKTNVLAPTSGELTPTYTLIPVGNTKNFAINGQDTGIAIPSDTPEKAQRLTHLGPAWKVGTDGYYYIGNAFYCSDYNYIGCHGGNNNSIGIEMGVNASDDTYLTWQVTAQLVADICVRNGLDTSRVKQHNTWTGKNCPQCLIAGNYWWNFMKMVDVNYEIMKNYSDATITMVSNDPEIISANGRILNGPEKTTTVSYTVTVTIGGTSKSITLYNVVPGTTTWQQWKGSYLASKIWNDGFFSKNDIIDRPYND